MFPKTEKRFIAFIKKCTITIVNIFKHNIKFQDRVDFILFHADMVKYYHGIIPSENVRIGEYYIITFYQHDKWITELALHIPTTSTGAIDIPYMRHATSIIFDIEKGTHQDFNNPRLLNEKLWPYWGLYTPKYRYRTILFSGETPNESRTAALLFINDEKERFLALTPWQFELI